MGLFQLIDDVSSEQALHHLCRIVGDPRLDAKVVSFIQSPLSFQPFILPQEQRDPRGNPANEYKRKRRTREAQIVMYADTFFCEGIRGRRDNAGFISPTKGLFSGG